jgi:hypothetical protein
MIPEKVDVSIAFFVNATFRVFIQIALFPRDVNANDLTRCTVAFWSGQVLCCRCWSVLDEFLSSSAWEFVTILLDMDVHHPRGCVFGTHVAEQFLQCSDQVGQQKPCSKSALDVNGKRKDLDVLSRTENRRDE